MGRLHKTVFAGMFFVMLGVTAHAKDYTAIKPGLWEIQTHTKMLGMPVEMPPVPYKAKQCLTQEQLNNQENLASVSGAQGDCQIQNVDVTDERTIWAMECVNKGMQMQAEGELRPISSENYNGNVSFTMQGGGGLQMRGHVVVEGRWLGACDHSMNEATPVFNR